MKKKKIEVKNHQDLNDIISDMFEDFLFDFRDRQGLTYKACGERPLEEYEEGIEWYYTQKAMDLKYHGLMIETHFNPDKAWTDSKQQIDAAALAELLNKLKIRNHHEIENSDITEFRAQLQALDEDIIHLLRERMKISETIGLYKKEHNLAVLQSSQWEETLKKNVGKAIESDLAHDFSTSLFKLIHEESIHIQSEILKSDRKREDC
jgi:chorismate mutase